MNFMKSVQDNKTIKLSEYYKTLPDRNKLVGLKVYDEINDEYLYIKSADSGLWCGTNPNDELGHYYSMDRLTIQL